jgi:small subunit ribosomal protein S1
MTQRKLSDLKTDQELEGTVTKTALYGAFVDVGAERDGLVHISMLKKGNVKRVEDVVEVGQQVKVWVHRVDSNEGRLELTMTQPVDLKWKDIKPGMILRGKVVRLESFGAFVDVGAERPGLVHISELSSEYVRNTGDVVSVGDEVEVKVLDVDRKKRQIRLSMKLEESIEEYEEEQPEEELPTAMEVAMRRALDETEQDKSNGKVDSTSKASRDEQEDILLRTLKHRMKTKSSGKE